MPDALRLTPAQIALMRDCLGFVVRAVQYPAPPEVEEALVAVAAFLVAAERRNERAAAAPRKRRKRRRVGLETTKPAR